MNNNFNQEFYKAMVDIKKQELTTAMLGSFIIGYAAGLVIFGIKRAIKK